MTLKNRNNIESSLPEELKFLVDASLAGLARWLRITGYDTTVFDQEAGRNMLRMAEKEGRIVLTRRRDMMDRQFSGSLFLITEIEVGRQLKSVIKKFSLRIEKQKMFGICLVCNTKLHPVDREEIRDGVPSYVFENCFKYTQCPHCGKIYWMGTHPRNALRFMERHIPNHLP